MSEYDDIIMDMGQGSRYRGVKKGRKRERIIVRRSTILLTAEMNAIIERYMFKNHKKVIREVVYDALEALARQEGYDKE